MKRRLQLAAVLALVWFGSSPTAQEYYRALSYVIDASSPLAWGSTGIAAPDLFVYRDGPNILAQRNATAAQEWRLFNTTDGTNKEYLELGWQQIANRVLIRTTTAGTGTDRNMTLRGASLQLQNSTGLGITVATTTGAVVFDNSAKSTNATAGVGYGTGAGGAVTQLTNRTTTVVLNTVSGDVTLFSAAGSATAASFTVTNSAVVATDNIVINQKSGTNLYNTIVTNVGAGSFVVTFYTTGGTAVDAPVFHFSVIKGVNS